MKEKLIHILIITLLIILYLYFFQDVYCLEKLQRMEPIVVTDKVNDLSDMDSKTKAYLYVSFLIISVYLLSKFI